MKRLTLLLGTLVLFCSTSFGAWGLVPRNNHGDYVGTELLHWCSAYIDNVNVSTVTGSGVNLTGGCTAQIFYGDGSKLTGIVTGGGDSIYPATSTIIIPAIKSAGNYMVVIDSFETNGGVAVFKGSVTSNGAVWLKSTLKVASDSTLAAVTGMGSYNMQDDNSFYSSVYTLTSCAHQMEKCANVSKNGLLFLGNGMSFIIVSNKTGSEHAMDYRVKESTHPQLVIYSGDAGKYTAGRNPYGLYGSLWHNGQNFVIYSGSATGTSSSTGGINFRMHNTDAGNVVNSISTWTAQCLDVASPSFQIAVTTFSIAQGLVKFPVYATTELGNITPPSTDCYATCNSMIYISTGTQRGAWKNLVTGAGCP